MSTNAIEVSIQAVSPELICELRMTEGSLVEGAGGATVVAGAAAPAPAEASGAEAGGADAGAVAEEGVAGAGGSAHAPCIKVRVRITPSEVKRAHRLIK